MQDLITVIRDVLGTPDFYIENGNYSSTWDYGAMLEYAICGILLCVVVVSVFKFLRALIK